jgi:hypothetical protein
MCPHSPAGKKIMDKLHEHLHDFHAQNLLREKYLNQSLSRKMKPILCPLHFCNRLVLEIKVREDPRIANHYHIYLFRD